MPWERRRMLLVSVAMHNHQKHLSAVTNKNLTR